VLTKSCFARERDKRGVAALMASVIFWQVGRQCLAAFLNKLHSFTKFLEINLKEPGNAPLSEITGRRSKPKRER
jgi:hypothetical protein